MVGCIIGTGTNACYVERADAVQKWEDPLPESGEMVRFEETQTFDYDNSMIHV